MKKFFVATICFLMSGFVGVHAQGVSKSYPKNEKEAKKQIVDGLKNVDPAQSKSQDAQAVKKAVEDNKVTSELVVRGQASVGDYEIVIPKGTTYSVKTGRKTVTVKEWVDKTPEERQKEMESVDEKLENSYKKAEPSRYLSEKVSKIVGYKVTIPQKYINEYSTEYISNYVETVNSDDEVSMTQKQMNEIEDAAKEAKVLSTEEGQAKNESEIERLEGVKAVFAEWCKTIKIKCEAGKK